MDRFFLLFFRANTSKEAQTQYLHHFDSKTSSSTSTTPIPHPTQKPLTHTQPHFLSSYSLPHIITASKTIPLNIERPGIPGGVQWRTFAVVLQTYNDITPAPTCHWWQSTMMSIGPPSEAPRSPNRYVRPSIFPAQKLVLKPPRSVCAQCKWEVP